MSARILVVDDIPANIRLLEAKLSAEYFEVLSAEDGPSALEIAASQAPDIILLDIMMPGMDGFEVCERLKANPRTTHIPVVMVTALSDTKDRVRGLECGADDFLSKPLNDVALFARVRSLTRLKVMMDELRVRHATSGQFESGDASHIIGHCDAENGKVLLVDSDHYMIELVQNTLSRAGHTVQVTSDGASALQAGGTIEQLDMIVIDMAIHGQDALRLCSQFRSQDETRHVPILLILEAGELDRLAKGLELGVTDYLIQPVDENELLARSATQIRRRRYHDRLRNMLESSVSLAYTDPLTGVYNRRYMSAHLDRKIMEVGDVDKAVSVMLFDIDHFKEVNDTHGHAAGDDILRGIALRVGESIRDFDLLARFGGEEFLVTMPNTPADAAAAVAERLRARIEREAFWIARNHAPVKISVSVGVATTTDPSDTADGLIARADSALYEAKRGGRNRVCVAGAAPEFVDQRTVAGG